MLTEVLWAYRTTRHSPTGETPFRLAIGCEVVIPTKVSLPTRRSVLVMSDKNDKNLRADLILVEELRDAV